MVNLLLEYKGIYPAGTETIDDLSQGIPQKIILQAATTFLNSDILWKNWGEVLNILFRKENQEYAQGIATQIHNRYVRQGQNPTILTTITCLKLLQVGLNFNEVKPFKSEQQIEIDFFKICLLLNQAFTELQGNNEGFFEEYYPEEKIVPMLLSMAFSTSDLTNYNYTVEFYSQTVKAFIFFRFIENHELLNHHLQSFLQKYKVDNLKGYYIKAVPFIQFIANKKKDGFIEINIPPDKDYESNKFFIDKLSVQEYSAGEDVDFKVVREHPLIEMEKDIYRISHPIFFTDKLYKGLYFEFSNINSHLDAGRLPNFRTYYTTHFSEKYLLYEILNYTLNEKYFKLNGAEIENMNIPGGPDFYVNVDNYIFLFENKDVLINAKIKESPYFPDLDSELRKKFLQDGNRGVGVKQIINNIEKVLNYTNAFDKDYDPNKVIIYPVLVVHDIMFDTPGFNALLNIWFDDELFALEDKGIDISKVKPLTVLKIDTLIICAELIKSNKLNLKGLCEIYLEGIKLKKNSAHSYAELEDIITTQYLPSSKIIEDYLSQKFPNYLKHNKILKKYFIED
ncbi:MAG: hypothetical protein JWO92_1060 [Chitinophagaceae bacterium]|nr:hypothetical protein [Chitinophagaceae bacterium]